MGIRVSAMVPRPASSTPGRWAVPSAPGAPPTPRQEGEYAGLRADIAGAMAAPGYTPDDRIARYGYVNACYTLGYITLPQHRALIELLGITYEEQEDILA